MSEIGILVRCAGTWVPGPAPSDSTRTGMTSRRPETHHVFTDNLGNRKLGFEFSDSRFVTVESLSDE